MALDWTTVTARHVQQACDAIVLRPRFRNRDTGLVVHNGAHRFSAKEVLREAYRLANRLPPDAALKFSSGEATLNVLRKLGFRAERLAPSSDSSA